MLYVVVPVQFPATLKPTPELPDVPELPSLPDEPLLPDVPLVPDVVPLIGTLLTYMLPVKLISVKLICSGELLPLPSCTYCNVFVSGFVLSVNFKSP